MRKCTYNTRVPTTDNGSLAKIYTYTTALLLFVRRVVVQPRFSDTYAAGERRGLFARAGALASREENGAYSCGAHYSTIPTNKTETERGREIRRAGDDASPIPAKLARRRLVTVLLVCSAFLRFILRGARYLQGCGSRLELPFKNRFLAADYYL